MTPQIRRLAVASLAALALHCLPLPAAVIILNDGKRIEGEATDKGASWEVRTRYGTLTIQKEDVWKVVNGLTQFTDEADALRRQARELYESASRTDDAVARNQALTVAIDRLGQALRIYEEARTIFAGAEHEDLDRIPVEILKAIRLCREAMGSEQTGPVARTPSAVTPVVTLDPPSPPSSPAQAERWLADLRKAAESRRLADVRYLASRILQQYPDTPAADEARAILDAIPHPDGRLVCGFDDPKDLSAWRVVNPYKKSVVFSPATDPKEVKDGTGAARLSLPRDPDYTTGALVLELGTFDETQVKGISFWLHQDRPSPGRLEVAFIRPKQTTPPWIDRWGGSELGACLYYAIPLDFAGWKQVRIPLSAFRARGASGSGGRIGWRDVGAMVLYDASRKGLDVTIDGLRFQEAESIAAR